MGEQQQTTLFLPGFNSSVRVEASKADLSEDAGVMVLREVAQRVGLDNAVQHDLVDRRHPSYITHSLASLIRTATFMLAQGWTDQDDADCLRDDVAFRLGVAEGRGSKTADQALASQPTMSRMVNMLSDAENLPSLQHLARTRAFADIDLQYGHRREMTIDVDSFPRVTHGHQEGSAYNGHYHDNILHPIVAIADTGHFLGGEMRAGNAHTALEAREFLQPILDDARLYADKLWCRFDAGYVAPSFMDWLDDEGVRFLARVRNNSNLAALAEAFVARTRAIWDANPSEVVREATFELRYRAGTWSRERRVIAVMVERVDGDGMLFDSLFFLVTNVALREGGSAAILKRYRQRGRAENHIGELVNVIGPKVSCSGLAQNEVVLLLGMLAYNLVHHVRRCLERALQQGISLQRVRERYLKAAVHVVRHARRIVLRVARSKVDAWRELASALSRPFPAAAEVC